jgi:DNA topoisomerase-1
LDLVIVESPTKAQTIKKILSKIGYYEVIATKGHILNLPEHELGINIENNRIKAKWVYEKGKREIVHKIRKYFLIYSIFIEL